MNFDGHATNRIEFRKPALYLTRQMALKKTGAMDWWQPPGSHSFARLDEVYGSLNSSFEFSSVYWCRSMEAMLPFIPEPSAIVRPYGIFFCFNAEKQLSYAADIYGIAIRCLRREVETDCKRDLIHRANCHGRALGY